MKLPALLITLIILSSSCHVYYSGSIINRTLDTIKVITKPSLLIFQKDSVYQELVERNLENNDSVFICFVKPNDTLKINGGPSYSSALQSLNYLKASRNKGDSIILGSKKEIKRHTEIIEKKINRFKIAVIVSDSLFSIKRS